MRRVRQTWPVAPLQAGYEPEEWLPGERLRGQYSFRLAAGLESGIYHFELDGHLLGQMAIQAPLRLFDEPAYAIPSGANFDDQAQLVGLSLTPPIPEPQTPFTVTLIWQGLAEMPVSYRVFVHLIDKNGEIVDQSDGEPVGWTRPTTGWAPGEYLSDEHVLRLPSGYDAGDMALRIGLYDAATGRRLQTAGSDYVVVPLLMDPA
jgi:hypothetical protein